MSTAAKPGARFTRMAGPESLPDSCDVAIIGAGFAGIALALNLAREHVDVVLLEAQPCLGMGASGRSVGLVETGVVEHPHRTLRALGQERASTLFAWTDHGKQLLEAEGLFTRSGVCWAAADDREPAELKESADALNRLGRGAEWLDGPETSARTGAANVTAGLWLPDDGTVTEDALDMLAQRAVDAGAKLVGSARASLLESAEEDVLVAVGDRTMRAAMVCIAAGHASADLDDSLVSRISPVREQALLTAPASGHYPGCHRAGQGWMRWRQQPDGRLLVGGARWASPHMGIGECDPLPDDAVQPRIEAFCTKHLEPLAVEKRWGWVFASTPDGLPFIGRLPGDPRRLVAAGFGPTPIALSMAAARVLADGLLHGQAEVPWFLSPRRMVRWRQDRG